MDNQTGNKTELLRPEEVARYLELSIDTLAKWRYRGKGPAYMKMDHAIRYSREALEQYLAKRTVPEGR
jgi:excisionase family DNA binding protein